jgi:hypothetical protein
MRDIRGAILGIGAVLVVFLMAPMAGAAEDPIFANGFDPCCSLGGTVSGLSSSGLTLSLGVGGSVRETRALAAGSVRYRFVASVTPGESYAITVASQPSGQACSVTHDSGAMSATDIADANVVCTTASGLVWDAGNWDSDTWQ